MMKAGQTYADWFFHNWQLTTLPLAGFLIQYRPLTAVRKGPFR
jgi:hypothetical protein